MSIVVHEETVSIPSAGLRLHGVVSVPADLAAGERRAAFLVLHGFGGNCKSQNVCSPPGCWASSAM